ncbi:hypothetical protein [Sphingopyxis macrogoltabida]|uniref:Uncharacterized protein n=1 Tax=Sphingopyxis macrogoltabida TaxID=33050 RepID=A0AAC8Z2K7_SPHMC|nr:hypothetical protein [Sphingopyxis macrogoltabida]ALJ14416.1 hypothetical protein LH19_16215 [Sphingopyxis macrogoltabida]AMU90681.1 hypothetical protein ATM17_16790 [Sphingopyxis macrogoltabida]
MNLFKKAAITLAATSMAVAPVAASAAPAAAAFDGVRATSTVEGQSELENSTWLYGLLALAAIIGLVLILDDNKDDPVSV